MSRRLCGIILAGLTLIAGCTRKDGGGGIGSGTGGWPPASSSSPAEISSSAQVVKASASPVQIAPGATKDATVILSILPGYHVNANPATFPYLIATEITTGKAEGLTAEKPNYPAGEKHKFEFAEEPLAVYEGNTQVTMKLRADSKASAGSRSLPVTVTVQACDTEKCYPPAGVDLTIPIEVK